MIKWVFPTEQEPESLLLPDDKSLDLPLLMTSSSSSSFLLSSMSAMMAIFSFLLLSWWLSCSDEHTSSTA